MNDKPLAYIVATLGFVGCCVGIPLLIVFLSGSAFFTWLGGAPLPAILVVLFGVAIYALVRRSRKRAAERGAGPVRERTARDRFLGKP